MRVQLAADLRCKEMQGWQNRYLVRNSGNNRELCCIARELQQGARLLHSVKWQPCNCCVCYRHTGVVQKSKGVRRKLKCVHTKKRLFFKSGFSE